MSTAYQYGLVTVNDDGTVNTPAGWSALTETEISYEGATPVVHSKGSWSPGMVVLACIVAIFTCGLGLILLFLSRSEKTQTTVMDTVKITGPNYTYLAQAPGGASFVSWTETWRSSMLQSLALAAAAPLYELPEAVITDAVIIESTSTPLLTALESTERFESGTIDLPTGQPEGQQVGANGGGESPSAGTAAAFCSECGATTPSQARFCTDCGTAVAS